jgi:hypothetical protein
MDAERPDNQLANGLLWHRPQVQQLMVAEATATIKILKNGSTEDLLSRVVTNDWPSGVPFPDA